MTKVSRADDLSLAMMLDLLEKIKAPHGGVLDVQSDLIRLASNLVQTQRPRGVPEEW
jgi:hypothetical protein